MTQAEWETLCYSAENLPGFEAWAAITDGELAGAVIICRIDDMFNVPYAMSHSRYLRNHVNNAVFYATSRNMLEREGVNGIFYTVQSLDAPANVDEFKFRMGFQRIAVRQCVDFHPLLNPIANKRVHSWTQKLLQRAPFESCACKGRRNAAFSYRGQ